MKRRSISLLLIGMGLLIASACQTSTPVRPTPGIAATVTTEQRNDANIKLSDNAKTFSYHLTDRFSTFLEDTKYPVKDLSCMPDGVIGTVSNGSLGGPGRYPVMFEAVREGKCRLADHDFHVDIVVKP